MSQPQSHLLSLPAELRTMIWEFVDLTDGEMHISILPTAPSSPTSDDESPTPEQPLKTYDHSNHRVAYHPLRRVCRKIREDCNRSLRFEPKNVTVELFLYGGCGEAIPSQKVVLDQPQSFGRRFRTRTYHSITQLELGVENLGRFFKKPGAEIEYYHPDTLPPDENLLRPRTSEDVSKWWLLLLASTHLSRLLPNIETIVFHDREPDGLGDRVDLFEQFAMDFPELFELKVLTLGLSEAGDGVEARAEAYEVGKDGHLRDGGTGELLEY